MPLVLDAYEYSGRMLFTDPLSDMGLTFTSQFTEGASYYRLRR